ncbi:MAG: hypothetical protein KBF88_07370 [Polyangiaceae bacterium]|nr:hypothetical protein [Polyangiaceae bacterium]
MKHTRSQFFSTTFGATLSFSLLGALAFACSSSEEKVNTDDFGDTGTSDAGNTDTGTEAAKDVDLSGEITADLTLRAKDNNLLKGITFVKSGVTLTIEKGTVIKGDNASKAVLVIQPGAKIIAEGTESEPIVFTSQAAEGSKKAGDWGGIILLGKAPINVPGGTASVEGITNGGSYGGTDAADSSGSMRFVRIEYSGVLLSPNNEVNGLTFAGVGSGTKIDHIQVRHTLDDCFEFFGGTVNAKYLACQYNQDDGLDFDFGYKGKIQFFVLQQDPNIADDTNGFESDNDAQGSANAPQTEPTVYNATLCGHGKEVGKQQYGWLLRRNTKGHYFNVLTLGFEAGVDVRDTVTGAGATSGGLEIKNSLVFGSVGADLLDGISYPESGAEAPNKDNDGNFDEAAWFKGATNGWSDPGVAGCFDANAPSFAMTKSPGLAAATPPGDGFFDATATYVGAFKDANDDWARKGTWAVWKDK